MRRYASVAEPACPDANRATDTVVDAHCSPVTLRLAETNCLLSRIGLPTLSLFLPTTYSVAPLISIVSTPYGDHLLPMTLRIASGCWFSCRCYFRVQTAVLVRARSKPKQLTALKEGKYGSCEEVIWTEECSGHSSSPKWGQNRGEK